MTEQAVSPPHPDLASCQLKPARSGTNGFFIPYSQVIGIAPRDYPGLRPMFKAAEPVFRRWISSMETYAKYLERIAQGGPGLLGCNPARFTQEWFPRLDAVAAYVLVREVRPRRIIEVGSGHSTRFLSQAINDSTLTTDLVCVDPRPRAPIADLPVRQEARPFGLADVHAVAALAPNDILFIDSSHVAMPGTEIDRLVLDVLPRLANGVLVHFHDVFLPDGYPEVWSSRGYNEQLVIGALLQGGAFDLVFASHYVAAHTNLIYGTVIERLALTAGAYEGSLWLRKGRS